MCWSSCSPPPLAFPCLALALPAVARTVPLKSLMQDALILAKNKGYDVFNALDLLQNEVRGREDPGGPDPDGAPLDPELQRMIPSPQRHVWLAAWPLLYCAAFTALTCRALIPHLPCPALCSALTPCSAPPPRSS